MTDEEADQDRERARQIRDQRRRELAQAHPKLDAGSDLATRCYQMADVIRGTDGWTADPMVLWFTGQLSGFAALAMIGGIARPQAALTMANKAYVDAMRTIEHTRRAA